jgi:hypothetical protein
VRHSESMQAGQTWEWQVIYHPTSVVVLLLTSPDAFNGLHVLNLEDGWACWINLHDVESLGPWRRIA